MSADHGFSPLDPAAVWVRNRDAACTTASVLIGLGLLGVPSLPALGPATLELGATAEFGAPAILDYVALPFRRAPLDVAIERLAAGAGARVSARTGLVLPGWPLRTRPGEVLLAHLAYGQQRPGAYGSWGFRLFDRSTWSTGGHSVVVLAAGPEGWRVLDPNLEGVQRWPRPGVAVTRTRMRRI